MFSLTASRYYLYRQPTDMRKSFDGLYGIVRNKLDKNPMSGDVFLFINKKRDRIKLLRWESGGFVLFYKRLEKGTFHLPDTSAVHASHQLIDYPELVMIINGISMKNARKYPRFFPHENVGK